MKKNILVWDLPLRLFHWTFAGSLTVALAIGFLVDDDSPVFQLHTLFGLVAAFALVIRVLLGVVGSRHNRFSAMPLRPGAVVTYFLGTLTGKARRYIGHNPGCALAAMVMFTLVPLLIVSGAGWLGEIGEELHEGLAIALLATIAAHLAGIIWHTLRHKEAIGMSMVTGRKKGPEEEGLANARPGWAIVMLAVGIAWVWALFSSHDPRAETVRIPLTGIVLDIGEYDGGEYTDDDDDD
ncbi:MAG: cytochrome b/b6 domain-containing protein [Akkermansiaceae bacterium]|nr:cytochrome b/b6 domain-containing protein [Akkermansiaceae bacterium]